MPLSPALSAVAAATPGFLPPDEGEALLAAALRAPAGTWLEVGTYCGKSTVHLGSAARTTGAHLVPGGLLLVHDVFERPEDGGRPPWHVFCRAREEGFTEVGASGSLRVLRREP